MERRELRQPRPHRHVLDHPGDDLLERRGHGRELGVDLLAQRDLAGKELVAEALALLPVPEFLEDGEERVALGDRPVPVDNQHRTPCV